MKILSYNNKNAVVTFNSIELKVISNVLNEVIYHIDDWEFQTRLGLSKKIVMDIKSTIDDLIEKKNID